MNAHANKKVFAWTMSWILISGLALLPACQKARLHTAGGVQEGAGLHENDRGRIPEQNPPEENTDTVFAPIPDQKPPVPDQRPDQEPIQEPVTEQDDLNVDQRPIDRHPTPVQTPVQQQPPKKPRVVTWMSGQRSQEDILSECHGGPENTDCEPKPVAPAPKPPTPEQKPPVAQKPPLPEPKPEREPRQCEPMTYTQPDGYITDKLDLIFVVDSSNSLDKERMEIAAEIEKFVQSLPPGNDYNIGLLPAHGPSKTQRTSGLLYSADTYDPFILKSSKMSIGEIRNQLVHKMQTLPRDDSYVIDSEGKKRYFRGEAGLLSLYRFFTDPTSVTHRMNLNFPRKDAALAVVFITDENDVCYDYKPGEQRNYATKGDLKDELAAFEYCQTAGPQGGPLTPSAVYEELQYAQGDMPLILSGIMYTDPARVPHDKQQDPKYYRDNEIGRGYLDLIQMSQGHAVELADRNFAESMDFIGEFAKFKVEYYNVFPMDLPYADAIDTSSVRITIHPDYDVNFQEGVAVPTSEIFFLNGDNDPEGIPKVGISERGLKTIIDSHNNIGPGSHVRITCELLE